MLIINVPVANAFEFSQIHTSSVSSEFSIYSNNLIKNFKFTKFNGIDLQGTSSAYGNKLKFETQPNWELTQDNIKLINSYTVGDQVYLYYQVALTNKINIYISIL